MRENNRAFNALRTIKIIPSYLDYADASAYIEMGHNKIIASATCEEKVPHFLKGHNQGWINAEYSMLPCSTSKRNMRERNAGRILGRNQEIQRLIGRSLRAAVDLHQLGERTITIDCDVIQADGGTRTASVTTGCVALALILNKMVNNGTLTTMPLKNLIGAVSVGLLEGEAFLDLDYKEDSNAEMDMNVVMTDTNQYIEIQATAEKKAIPKNEFNNLLSLAEKGIGEIIEIQKNLLKKESILFIAYS